MANTEFTGWRKSTLSDADGNCVEVGRSVDGSLIGVRDTQDRGAAMLTFERGTWQKFIHDVRGGLFDVPS